MDLWLAIYLANLIFGGVFVGLSVVSGLGDSDVDVDKEVEFDKEFEFDKELDFDKEVEFEFDKEVDFDLDLDGDADVDADADADGDAEGEQDIETHARKRYIPFLSFKFYTFTAAFFGLTGTVLSFVWDNNLGVFALSTLLGLAAGLGMTYLLHVANQSEGGRVAGSRELAGTMAKVTIPIQPGKRGKVKLRIKGQVVEMMAENYESDDGVVFDFGEDCFVLGMEDGVVKVMHPAQLEQRRKK